MAVTIKDIAKHLNIAPSTVSKALNNYPHVSAEMRLKVKAAAEMLNYVPSITARNLRRQRTNKIGFSFSLRTPEMSDDVAAVVNGAVIAAVQKEYNLTLYPSLEESLFQLTQLCRAREVDGMLLFGQPEVDPVILRLLTIEKMPFVVIGQRVDDADVSFVKADDKLSAYAMTNHLLDLGHKRIGFTTRPKNDAESRDRLMGYKSALDNMGIPFDPALIVPTTLDKDSGYLAMHALLDLENRPTAVIAIHDLVAADCLRAAVERGLNVPEDVAIAGFNDLRDSLTTQPPLTTIRTPWAKMGARAMQLLLAKIGNTDLPAQQISLATELVVRGSTNSS